MSTEREPENLVDSEGWLPLRTYEIVWKDHPSASTQIVFEGKNLRDILNEPMRRAQCGSPQYLQWLGRMAKIHSVILQVQQGAELQEIPPARALDLSDQSLRDEEPGDPPF